MIDKSTKKQKKKYGDVPESDFKVERVVPVTETEILGVSLKKGEGVILEFGFMKDEQDESVIIDTRKYLPKRMAEDLYLKLKLILEDEDLKSKSTD